MSARVPKNAQICTCRVPVHAIDAVWLRNAVLEPLEEANVKLEKQD